MLKLRDTQRDESCANGRTNSIAADARREGAVAEPIRLAVCAIVTRGLALGVGLRGGKEWRRKGNVTIHRNAAGFPPALTMHCNAEGTK